MSRNDAIFRVQTLPILHFDRWRSFLELKIPRKVAPAAADMLLVIIFYQTTNQCEPHCANQISIN